MVKNPSVLGVIQKIFIHDHGAGKVCFVGLQKVVTLVYNELRDYNRTKTVLGGGFEQYL